MIGSRAQPVSDTRPRDGTLECKYVHSAFRLTVQEHADSVQLKTQQPRQSRAPPSTALRQPRSMLRRGPAAAPSPRRTSGTWTSRNACSPTPARSAARRRCIGLEYPRIERVVAVGVVGTGVVDPDGEDFPALVHRFLHVLAGVVAVAALFPAVVHGQVGAEYDGGVAVDVQVAQGDGRGDFRVSRHVAAGRQLDGNPRRGLCVQTAGAPASRSRSTATSGLADGRRSVSSTIESPSCYSVTGVRSITGAKTTRSRRPSTAPMACGMTQLRSIGGGGGADAAAVRAPAPADRAGSVYASAWLTSTR